jgi:hypothetical protein
MFGAAIYPPAYDGYGSKYDVNMRENIMSGHGIAQTVLEWLNHHVTATLDGEPISVRTGIFYPLWVHTYYCLRSLLLHSNTMASSGINEGSFCDNVNLITYEDDCFKLAIDKYREEYEQPLDDPPADFDWIGGDFVLSLRDVHEWESNGMHTD